jgi:competence CoiA-like predicted nuclease
VNGDEQLVSIDQVARGRTTLHCPYCGVRLLARKGVRLTPHFTHDGTKNLPQTTRF